jgi:hypothetical protein
MVYYYTYGSVLAALSRPRKNYCPDAVKLFQELRAFPYGEDTEGQALKRDVLDIVADGENICRSIGQPTQVPTPDGILTPIPTETPMPDSNVK